MRKPKTNLEAVEFIQNRIPFSVNSIAGSTYADRGVGRLSANGRRQLYAAANTLDYVVYSYATPIAWHTPEGWVIPLQQLSITTGRHQRLVRGAVGA